MDDDSVSDYTIRLIAQRCGEEIADAVVPVETVTMMLEIIAALQDRVDELALSVEAREAA
jgi:hypothetical protein